MNVNHLLFPALCVGSALRRVPPRCVVGHKMVTLLVTFLTLIFFGSSVHATHGAGSEDFVLRFSADASRMLVAECGVQGMDGELHVYDTILFKQLAKLDLTQLPEGLADAPSPLDLCKDDDADLDAALGDPKLDKQIRGLIKTHKLTVKPVRTARSPRGDSYALVMTSHLVIDAMLIEGATVTTKARWKSKSGYVSAGLLSTAWHPSGKLVAIYGSHMTAFDGTIIDHDAVLELWRPKASARRKVVATKVSKQLYRFAERERQDCRRKVASACTRAFNAYSKVVVLDKSRIIAWYMAARVAALDGKNDDAINALLELKKRRNKRARKLLRKARTQRDLKSLWKNPRFIALFK